MMPLSTFNLLVTVIVVMVLYSVIDYRNKLYANIAAAIIAAITGAILSILIYIGAVQTDNGATVISDFPTAAILIFITGIIALYTAWMIWDAKDEYEKEKERL